MKNLFSKNNKINNLESALKACCKADKEGYNEAIVYLNNLRISVEEASNIITECVDGMKKYHVNDKNLIQNIRKQLQIVQDEFKKSYYTTQINLKNKKDTSSTFNITLFGKTKVGKSTLMEILTHGDGSHMGKGAQRTTTDVRSYQWKGMSVTDVPGIEAYGGEEDDAKAEEAARYADLIIFMIESGQPEAMEADWMVKLKRMDKSIVCICNFKQRLGNGINDEYFKFLLSNPKRLKNLETKMLNLGELIEQFNTFLHDKLPNEHVNFLVTHLLAKFYSQQKEYISKKQELERISRFSFVEQSIIDEVYKNGVLHKKKSYLSIIDAPLYEQMNQLFAFSAEAYGQFCIIQDKESQFKDWCNSFNKNEKRRILGVIEQEYAKIKNSIPGFIERYLEEDNIGKIWEKHLKQFSIDASIKKCLINIDEKLTEKQRDIFSELETEMNFSLKNRIIKSNLSSITITNWKKRLEWGGHIAGAGSVILGCLSSPVGWCFLGISAIFYIFALGSDSREDKLKEARTKLSNKLNKSLVKSEQKTKSKLLKWYDKNIKLKEKQISKRLSIVGSSMLALANSERKLALGYSKNHKDITKKIITNIFRSMNMPSSEYKRITTVARVPGRRIVIVVSGQANLSFRFADFASRLGNKESVSIIKLDTSKQIKSQISYLFNYFKLNGKPFVKEVNNNTQTVVYLYDEGYNQSELDSIDLIQQILNVHIILK